MLKRNFGTMGTFPLTALNPSIIGKPIILNGLVNEYNSSLTTKDHMCTVQSYTVHGEDGYSVTLNESFGGNAHVTTFSTFVDDFDEATNLFDEHYETEEVLVAELDLSIIGQVVTISTAGNSSRYPETVTGKVIDLIGVQDEYDSFVFTLEGVTKPVHVYNKGTITV